MLDTGVSAALFDRGLCLPSGSSMSAADLGRVLDVLAQTIEGRQLSRQGQPTLMTTARSNAS
jgi:hypothetical protein